MWTEGLRGQGQGGGAAERTRTSLVMPPDAVSARLDKVVPTLPTVKAPFLLLLKPEAFFDGQSEKPGLPALAVRMPRV